jgi:hypothetical protein
MRCERCGRGFYSASAAVLVAAGDRCSECGGAVVVVEEADGADRDSPSE